ncbi:MAG: hypothetical protein ABIJ21_07400 [Nanoarchaeota archaeon]
MNKRAGAMEFLMTYGWFLLVFAGVLSALAYFNLFSPGDIQPSTCMTEPGVLCKDFKATGTTIILTLRNANIREFSNVGFGFENGFDTCTAATASDLADPGIPAAGTLTNQWWFNATNATVKEGYDIASFSFTGCSFSKRAIGHFSVEYQAAGEHVTHTLNGQANLAIE